MVNKIRRKLRGERHGGSRDLDRSVGGFDFDFPCTSLNSSHNLVLLRSPPAELGALEREGLLGLLSISLLFVPFSLTAP